MGGEIENKANSVQLLLQLPTGSELGKNVKWPISNSRKKGSTKYFNMNYLELKLSVNVLKSRGSHISQDFMFFIVAFVLIFIFNGPIDRNWGRKLQVWQLLNLFKWPSISFRDGFDFVVQPSSIVKLI